MIEPMDLPEIVSGLRIRQITPFGNMHVKITVDLRSAREFEVFAQLGKGGDVATSDLEAICRMISLWLRAGGSLKHVIKQLEGIGSSLQIPTRAGRIMSLGDGLACALKKYQKAKERFGLRALLLGDYDLAELENPLSPHSAASPILDRTVGTLDAAPAGGGNRDGNGNGADAEETPKANVAAAGPTHGAAGASPVEHGTTAPSATRAAPTNVAAGVVTVPPPPEMAAAGFQPHVPVTQSAMNDLLAAIRHTHDSASHYKIKCPQCEFQLVQQEGCQKCLSCGWSQC